MRKRREARVQLPLRVHGAVREAMRDQAAVERRTLNAVLEAAVLEYLDRHTGERQAAAR